MLALSQAIRRSGRPSVALPEMLLTPVGQGLSRAGLLDFSSEHVRFITYGRAIDTSLVERTFGFMPERSTPEVFEDFLTRFAEVERVA